MGAHGEPALREGRLPCQSRMRTGGCPMGRHAAWWRRPGRAPSGFARSVGTQQTPAGLESLETLPACQRRRAKAWWRSLQGTCSTAANRSTPRFASLLPDLHMAHCACHWRGTNSPTSLNLVCPRCVARLCFASREASNKTRGVPVPQESQRFRRSVLAVGPVQVKLQLYMIR